MEAAAEAATCVATLKGHSRWVRTVAFHPTAPERVRSQIAFQRAALASLGGSPSLANSAMAEQATIWAREWIESTRDPDCPDPAYFPLLERPAIHHPDDVDTLFPAFQRGRPFFEDGEDAVLSSGYSSQNSEH